MQPRKRPHPQACEGRFPKRSPHFPSYYLANRPQRVHKPKEQRLLSLQGRGPDGSRAPVPRMRHISSAHKLSRGILGPCCRNPCEGPFLEFKVLVRAPQRGRGDTRTGRLLPRTSFLLTKAEAQEATGASPCRLTQTNGTQASS